MRTLFSSGSRGYETASDLFGRNDGRYFGQGMRGMLIIPTGIHDCPCIGVDACETKEVQYLSTCFPNLSVFIAFWTVFRGKHSWTYIKCIFTAGEN